MDEPCGITGPCCAAQSPCLKRTVQADLLTCVLVQVSWEGDDSDGSTDDLSPWEVYSAEVDEDSLKAKLLGSDDAVTTACRRLGQKCHGITVQVCSLGCASMRPSS